MNTLYIGIIIAIIAVGVGAGVFLMSQTNQQSQPATTTTPTTTTTSQTTTKTTTTTHQGSGMDISGTWEGTFTASRWPGEKTGKWKWVIHRVSGNKYEGYLMTMDVYPTNGYIKIEVTLDGNKITVGTVGGEFAAAVFSGTVTGDGNNAQGTWKFTNGQDSGQWSGRRVSMSTSLPVTTTTEAETETTTTTHQSSTTTTTSSGSSQVQACGISLEGDYADAWKNMYSIFVDVFGSDNLKCIMGTTTTGQYQIYLNITSYDPAKLNEYADSITNGFVSEGWTILQKTTDTEALYLLMTKTFGNTDVTAVLQVRITPSEGEIVVVFGGGS